MAAAIPSRAKRVAPAPSAAPPKMTVVQFAALPFERGAIRTFVGKDYEGFPQKATISVTIKPQAGSNYVYIEGVDTSSMLMRRMYWHPSTTVEEPIVTYESKAMAEVAPLALALRPMRYHHHIGADPEVFVTKVDGSLFPSFEFLAAKPKASGYFAAYWDGYQAEFSFAAPSCMDGLVGNIKQGLVTIRNAARMKDPGAELSVATVFDVPAKRRESDDPKYVAFGCTPSLNAYEEAKEPLPDGIDVPFRSSGGHLHFSIDRGNTNKLLPRMVKEFDRILGVLSVAMFQYYDDPRRRTLYGKAGEYRAPKYGFEYRVLSSAWMIHPGIVQFIYEMSRTLIGCVQNGGKDQPLAWWDVTEDEARTCINNCDVALAVKLLERNRNALTSLLLAMPHRTECGIKEVARLIDGPIMKGVHTALVNPHQYSHDWDLPGQGGYRNTQWSGAFAFFIAHGGFDFD